MLQRVEEAGPGIAACRLPAPDDGAGRFVESCVDPGVEAESGQPACTSRRFAVEAELIFGRLSCFVGKDRRIDRCREVADSRARTGPGSICAGRIPRTDNASNKTRTAYSPLILKALRGVQIKGRPQFFAGQLLSGSLVPWRASIVPPHCIKFWRSSRRPARAGIGNEAHPARDVLEAPASGNRLHVRVE